MNECLVGGESYSACQRGVTELTTATTVITESQPPLQNSGNGEGEGQESQ